MGVQKQVQGEASRAGGYIRSSYRYEWLYKDDIKDRVIRYPEQTKRYNENTL